MAQSAEAVLYAAGIKNPQRIEYLIQKSINTLELDLSDLVVLTEAASRFYAVTPIIAAMASAKKVIAFTRDSRFATAEDVIAQTTALRTLCHAPDVIEVHTQRDLSLFTQADIVTNLGFVRPIDAEVIAHMKPTASISLMHEAWERRESDVDLAACRSKGITLLGTNEDFPGVDVFSYCGWLAQKLLFDAEIEVYKSHVLVIGQDRFSKVIASHFRQLGIESHRRDTLTLADVQDNQIDVIVIADYMRQDTIIGADGDVNPQELATIAPYITLIQFAGRVDVAALQAAGLRVYPGKSLESQRMMFTLAELGARPVVELHAAGLKVGEIAQKTPANLTSSDLAQVI